MLLHHPNNKNIKNIFHFTPMHFSFYPLFSNDTLLYQSLIFSLTLTPSLTRDDILVDLHGWRRSEGKGGKERVRLQGKRTRACLDFFFFPPQPPQDGGREAEPVGVRYIASSVAGNSNFGGNAIGAAHKKK